MGTEGMNHVTRQKKQCHVQLSSANLCTSRDQYNEIVS
jgi:hypothetical protein